MHNPPRHRNSYQFERPGHAYLRSIGPNRKQCECGQEMTREEWTIHLMVLWREPVDRPELIAAERREIKNDIRARDQLRREAGLPALHRKRTP
jgi:hypothetical protein